MYTYIYTIYKIAGGPVSSLGGAVAAHMTVNILLYR